MTLNTAAWAIDGATIDSSLARTEAYANSSGEEGIVQKGDLKVSPLDVPGNGLKISSGAALVLNRYQSTPDQMYVVTNPGSHTVPSASMPPSNVSVQTYIVAIAVGDTEFNNSGHPYMPASIPVEDQPDYEYVRPIVVLETAFNARNYPAVPLARLVVPANTTTITSGMLTDIRALARPRTKLEMAHTAGPASTNPLNGAGGTPGQYERWPNVGVITVTIPTWAVRAKVIGFVEGVKITKAGTGGLKAYIETTGLGTSLTNINESDPTSGPDRRSYNFGGEITLTDALRGTSQTFSVQATPNDTPSKGFLEADQYSSVAIQIYFEEKPT